VDATKFAAISIVAHKDSGVSRTIGVVKKNQKNPLFGQTEPWETRLDNGYPNVVPPSSSTSAWQLWYGGCASPAPNWCDQQILLYANSTDGIVWQKPSLGLYDVSGVRPDMASIGTQNNIIMEGGGIGVYHDEHDVEPTRRYKAIGDICVNTGSKTTVVSNLRGSLSRNSSVALGICRKQNIALSADGLHWHDAVPLLWPSPQRYDCHNNVFFDSHTDRYVATTRDGFAGQNGRKIAIQASPSADFGFSTDIAPAVTLEGTDAHQLYSQITFQWLNTYLGIVMVFDTAKPAEFGHGKVHCRLAWSNNPVSPQGVDGWQWVDPTGLEGEDFIPLGTPTTASTNPFDSHICFAAKPVSTGDEERIYYIGSDGPHNGIRNSSFGLASLRKDGFAALHGTGTVVTVPIMCSGAQLVITADFDAEARDAALQVGVWGAGAQSHLAVEHAVPLRQNGTDLPMQYTSGVDFSAFIGQNVTLELKLSSCLLYTVGWASIQEDTLVV